MTDRLTKPSLRERNRVRTRRAILEAMAELELAHGGALDPSVNTYTNIADLAGVSERTVYRFFPTKADLDAAYTAEHPMTLDVEIPAAATPAEHAELITTIMRRWSERLGNRPIGEHEPEAEDYPISLEARRQRDASFLGSLYDGVPGADAATERERRAIAAAVHSVVSIRTIAATAQRWGLSLEEAGWAHGWAMVTLAAALADNGIPRHEATP